MMKRLLFVGLLLTGCYFDSDYDAPIVDLSIVEARIKRDATASIGVVYYVKAMSQSGLATPSIAVDDTRREAVVAVDLEEVVGYVTRQPGYYGKGFVTFTPHSTGDYVIRTKVSMTPGATVSYTGPGGLSGTVEQPSTKLIVSVE